MTPLRLTLVVLALLPVSTAWGSESPKPAAERPSPEATPSQGGSESRGLQMLRALHYQSKAERENPSPPLSNSELHLRYAETQVEDLAAEVKDNASWVDKVDKKLQAVQAERVWLDKIKTAAQEHRQEANGPPMQTAPPSPSAPVEEENPLPDDPDLSGVKNWLDNKSFQQTDSPSPEQESEPPRRRTQEEIDADLRANGLQLTVDGETVRIRNFGPELASNGDFSDINKPRRFDSLEQLEIYLDAKSNYLDKHEAAATLERTRAQAALDEATRRRNYHERQLEEMKADNRTHDIAMDRFDRTRRLENLGNLLDKPDFNELFDAIAEEITSPSVPSAPSTPPTTTTDRSAVPDGSTGQLMQDLAGDLMTRQEYAEQMEYRAQENQPGPVIDDETRRQAAAVNQQLAATEASLAEAERRYQQLMQRNAQAEQIRQAWAQQEAIRRQWIQQQNFSQAVQQAFGGSRVPSSYGSPPISRSGGSSTPAPSRNLGGPSTGRRGGNAAGFQDLLSPVTDPNQAQQYQQTFGNRNKR